MASSANYASTPASATAALSAANTARDGTGTLVTVYTAPAGGARIDDLTITATGTTTAGMVRLFIHDGTSARLYREIPVLAATPSGTAPSWASMQTDLALVLPAGYSLRATTNNAEGFHIAITRAGAFA